MREDTLARVASISAAIVHKHADAERRAQQREAFRREIEEWQQVHADRMLERCRR